MKKPIIAILADPHIGSPKARKWGLTPEEWNAPLEEFAEYLYVASGNNINPIIAGDLFDSRTPTPSDYMVAKNFLSPLWDTVFVLEGNHDVNTADGSLKSPTALWWINNEKKPVCRLLHGDNQAVSIIFANYPRFAYWSDGKGSLYDQLEHAGQAWVKEFEDGVLFNTRQKQPDSKILLVGHLSFYYGKSLRDGEIAPSPNLKAGRDVLLPYEHISSLVDAVWCGHIHDSTKPGYVGSTQPTDFADTTPKGFIVLDEDLNHEFIPFTTAVKMFSATVTPETAFSTLESANKDAVAKITVELPHGSDWNRDKFRIDAIKHFKRTPQILISNPPIIRRLEADVCAGNEAVALEEAEKAYFNSVDSTTDEIKKEYRKLMAG